jgi:serine/threonine protein kinase
MPNNMNWQIGDTLEGLYRVDQVFTGGGMGMVYRVRHLGWEADLALKHPRAEFLANDADVKVFQTECETWANIGLHPHVATCYYVRKISTLQCVFAEYVDGGSLRDWITSKRLYRGEEATVIARIMGVAIQFAWGLAWAHRHGLVHQDVKPANVLMTPDGIVKVTDFGLAKAMPVTANVTSSLLASVRGMTPAYCSPEQASREPLSKATDVWSWAASILEMFTGGLSWQAGPAVGAALVDYNDQGRRVRGIPEMPVAVFELLAKCLHRDPVRRLSSFKTAADRLCGIYQELFGEEFELEEPDADLIIPDALNNRAVSLLDLDRVPEALGLLQKTLNFAPNHIQAKHNYNLLNSNPKQRVGFRLSVPRSGAEYSYNARRFKGLIEKAKLAAQDGRQHDVQRYIQTARELPGFEQHPALIRFTPRVI